MKSIIVPVNFSVNSHHAARYAADMALAVNAELHLIHVLQIPVGAVEVPSADYLMAELQRVATTSLHSLRDELQLRTKGRLQIYTTLEAGVFEGFLEAYCDLTKPLVVIMGATGNSTETLLVGSDSIAAVGRLPYPLLIVPGNYPFRPISNIVLACDKTDVSFGSFIPCLQVLQEVFNARIEQIYVDTGDRDRTLELQYPAVHFLPSRHVEEAINQYLVHSEADLVFVFPKRHGFFEFHRSHAKKVIRQSSIPVMSMRG